MNKYVANTKSGVSVLQSVVYFCNFFLLSVSDGDFFECLTHPVVNTTRPINILRTKRFPADQCIFYIFLQFFVGAYTAFTPWISRRVHVRTFRIGRRRIRRLLMIQYLFRFIGVYHDSGESIAFWRFSVSSDIFPGVGLNGNTWCPHDTPPRQ